MGKQKLPDDASDRFLLLYRQGMSQNQIGAEFGVSAARVCQLLSARADWSEHSRDSSLRWPQARIDELLRLHDLDWSVADIARQLKTNRRHVRRHLASNGRVVRSQSSAQSGAKNPSWNGGRMTSKGYVYLYRPDHPHARKNGYVAEHRLVMEEMIGRHLTRREVVHHKDGNRTNNLPENLQLFGSNGEHLAEELRGRIPKWTEDGRRRIREGAKQPRKPSRKKRRSRTDDRA